MALIRDTSGGVSASSVASKTQSVTVGNNANRRLTVVIASNGVTGKVAVSSVTYAGSALTRQVFIEDTFGNENRVEIWEMIAPATGANNLIITMASTVDFLDIGWVSLYNATQVLTAHKNNSGNAANTQNAAVTVVPTIDNCWGISIAYPTDNPSSGITGATEFMGTFFPDAGSSGPKTPPGTITQTYNGAAAGEDWTWAMVAVAPVTSVTVNASVQSIASSVPSYTVSVNESNAVATQVATFSIPAYTVTTTRNVSVSAGVQSCALSLPAATVATVQSVEVTPSAQTATFSTPAITVITNPDATINAGVQVVAITIPTYTVTAVAPAEVSVGVQLVASSALSVTVTTSTQWTPGGTSDATWTESEPTSTTWTESSTGTTEWS